MGLIDWLFNRPFITPKPLVIKKEYTMDFKEFTEKFRGGTNPETNNSWVLMGDAPAMAKLAGVSKEQVETWVQFWWDVQVMPLYKKENRMPTNGEIITEWNFRQGIVAPPVVTVTPVPLPPRDPATTIGTIFGRYQPAPKVAGLTLMSQYTPDQFEELIHHILCEHDEVAKTKQLGGPNAFPPAAPKALTVSVATDYQQQSILTWPFQKVIELWDALAHKS